MPTPTLDEFKQWSRDNARLALAVCETHAAAETIKLFEVEYIKPIFDSFNFIYEGNSVERLDTRRGEKLAGKPIPSPDDFNFCLLHGDDDLELLIGTCIKALDEMQQECGLETQHQEVEPSPLNPSRIRCANCCLELERKAA